MSSQPFERDAAFAAARALLSDAATVATFSGAGLSAESGVSTFRGQEPNALWSKYDPHELASVAGFEAEPERVIAWYNWRRSKLAQVAPNPAHVALARQPGLVHVTQNVDDLLERAGVPAAQVHHVHGTIVRDRCHAHCGHEEAIDLDDPPPLRDCVRCGETMRPAVVWFGESLPQETWRQAERICSAIDCLLVIGTSAVVYPAAGLIELARARGAKIIVVNPEAHGPGADVALAHPAGVVLPALLEGLTLRTR